MTELVGHVEGEPDGSGSVIGRFRRVLRMDFIIELGPIDLGQTAPETVVLATADWAPPSGSELNVSPHADPRLRHTES